LPDRTKKIAASNSGLTMVFLPQASHFVWLWWPDDYDAAIRRLIDAWL